jgi:hypothetical protein
VDVVLVGTEVVIELDIMRPHRFIHKGVESDFSDIFGMVKVLRVIPDVPCWGAVAWGRWGWRRVMAHGGSPWVIIVSCQTIAQFFIAGCNNFFEGRSGNALYCHGLLRKWTDLAVMTTLSDYISHGQGPEYCCSIDSHAVKCLIVL